MNEEEDDDATVDEDIEDEDDGDLLEKIWIWIKNTLRGLKI